MPCSAGAIQAAARCPPRLYQRRQIELLLAVASWRSVRILRHGRPGLCGTLRALYPAASGRGCSWHMEFREPLRRVFWSIGREGFLSSKYYGVQNDLEHELLELNDFC